MDSAGSATDDENQSNSNYKKLNLFNYESLNASKTRAVRLYSTQEQFGFILNKSSSALRSLRYKNTSLNIQLVRSTF